jgi:hypothetical protein
LNERRHVAPEGEVRTLRSTDREWLLALMEERWGGPEQVANGERFRPADLPGMVAEIDAARVGVVVLRIVGGRCEIGLIQSLREGVGVGTALMTAAIRQASASRRYSWYSFAWVIGSGGSLTSRLPRVPGTSRTRSRP